MHILSLREIDFFYKVNYLFDFFKFFDLFTLIDSASALRYTRLSRR
jgi:hypothetical protein